MTPRRARLLVDGFTACVIASIAFALAGLTWRLAAGGSSGPLAAPVAPGAGQAVDIRPLVALAPFGKAVTTGAPGDGGAVKLRAIFLSIPMETSVALIAGADGKVASYSVGQAVGDGVIESIAAEQVVLRTASGQRVLGFDPQGPAGAPVAVAAAAPAPVPAQAAAAAPAPAAGAPLTGAAAIRALIPKSVQGVAPAAPAAPPPAPPQPTQTGYRIGNTPNAAMAAAGIRPGDVVLQVNGNAVGPGTNERELMAQAVSAGAARLEIMRDGQRVSLTVPVR